MSFAFNTSIFSYAIRYSKSGNSLVFGFFFLFHFSFLRIQFSQLLSRGKEKKSPCLVFLSVLHINLSCFCRFFFQYFGSSSIQFEINNVLKPDVVSVVTVNMVYCLPKYFKNTPEIKSPSHGQFYASVNVQKRKFGVHIMWECGVLF